MKNHFWLLYILGGFVFFSCNSPKENKSKDLKVNNNSEALLKNDSLNSDTTYISLFVEIRDNIKKTNRNSILIIGKYFDGKYLPFEDILCENVGLLKKTDSWRIFQTNKKFFAYKNGILKTECLVDGLNLESFSCSTLAVGKINNKSFIESKSKPKQGYEGKSEGKDVNVSFDYLVALNKQISQNPNEIKLNLNMELQKRIKASLKTHFLDSLKIQSIDDKDLKINICSISKDTCFIVNYHHDTDSLCVSTTQVLKFSGKKPTKQLELFNVNSIDSWGSGYTFFDAIDIDNDGINELIFEVGYYESTGFEIYKLSKGRFKQVMSVIPWGC